MSSTKFAIGDRVKFNGEDLDALCSHATAEELKDALLGTEGTVVAIDEDAIGDYPYLVEMDEPHPLLHDGNWMTDYSCRDECGWWADDHQLEAA